MTRIQCLLDKLGRTIDRIHKTKVILSIGLCGIFLTSLAMGQAFVYPSRSEESATKTNYRFSNLGLASGVLWDEGTNTYFYRDFVVIIFYDGPDLAQIEVRLTDNLGLNFNYREDNLKRPLVIDGTSQKKTIMLNVAGVAFPLSSDRLEYHPDISVEIDSNKPIYVLPLTQFATVGHGPTVSQAEENGWENFGFAVPRIKGRVFHYFPYSIFWRNLRAFPNGWDTKITISNAAAYGISIRLHYFPDYRMVYDPATCTVQHLNPPVPKDVYVGSGEVWVLYLRELLGASLQDSYQTEGALGLESLSYNELDTNLNVTLEVLPLTRGTRICTKTPPGN
jgi:hypothetical protein